MIFCAEGYCKLCTYLGISELKTLEISRKPPSLTGISAAQRTSHAINRLNRTTVCAGVSIFIVMPSLNVGFPDLIVMRPSSLRSCIRSESWQWRKSANSFPFPKGPCTTTFGTEVWRLEYPEEYGDEKRIITSQTLPKFREAWITGIALVGC